MGSSNMTSYYGGVRNPWTRPGDNGDLVPGGSSGGSAAAVAARLCLGATGTDTGGSIRQPAAFCGIVGIKPTYGRCSRWGIVAFASSLDQAGPMARTVEDCALLLQAMAGHDPMDSTSADLPVPDWAGALTGDVRGPADRHPEGIPVPGMPAEIDGDLAAGCRLAARRQGAELVEVSLPHTKYALPTYYIIAPAEASSNLARYDGMRFGLRVEGKNLAETYMKTRAAGFGAEVQRRVLIGTYVLSAGYYDAYYLQGAEGPPPDRRRLRRRRSSGVDALLTPTAPSAAFRAGDNMDDPVAMYLNDVFTVTVNLAGLPGLSVPAGPRRRRPAARAAGDRPRLGRGDGVQGRQGAGGGGRFTTLPYGLEEAA